VASQEGLSSVKLISELINPFHHSIKLYIKLFTRHIQQGPPPWIVDFLFYLNTDEGEFLVGKHINIIK
jgi:hypothetical protein